MAEQSGRTARILVVEDDDMLARGMRDLLEWKGYPVKTAQTAAEAEACWKEWPADLYILDMQLPDGDGISLCRKLRRFSEAPVLFLTVCEDERYVVEALGSGGDDPCIGIGLVWERAQGIPIFHSRHDGEYELNLPTEEKGLRPEQLEQLSYIYGISEVRAWHRLSARTTDACDGYLLSLDARDYLDDRYVQWAVQYNMEFQQSITEIEASELERLQQNSDSSEEMLQEAEKGLQQSKSKEKKLEEGYLPISLLSTSNETEIQRLFENLGEGSISVSDFREGKGALLLLPAGFQREYLDGEYIEWTYQEAIQ